MELAFVELGEVGDEVLGEGVPGLALAHAEVDVRAGELVDVELRPVLDRLRCA